MATYFPSIYATIAYADRVFGYMEAPGFVWTIPPMLLAADESEIVGGRYVEPLGSWLGNGRLKLRDTYRSGESPPGGGSFDGRAFVPSGGGSWQEVLEGTTNKWALLQPDSEANNTDTPTLLAADTTEGIEYAEALLGRGWSPVSPTLDTRSPENDYVYIELAHGSEDGLNYRIALEYGNPIALDKTEDGGANWKRVKQLRNFPNVQNYFGRDGNAISFRIYPNYRTNRLVIEVGNGRGVYLMQKGLPKQGRIRVVTKNAWTLFAYLTLCHDPLTFRKPASKPVHPRTNLGATQVIGNALSPDRKERVSGRLISDGQGKVGFEASVERDTDCDTPPELTDLTLIAPAIYTFDLASTDGQPINTRLDVGVLAVETIDELEVFDEASRSIHYTALLSCSNADGRYTGSFGRTAVNVMTSNGAGYVQRMLGYGGDGEQGITFLSQENMIDQALLPVTDCTPQMRVPICDEILVDNWAWPSIVRFVAREKCGVHESRLEHIPRYVPPDGTWELPYGPAGEDCPYYIPFRGLGGAPQGRFGPTVKGWDILLLLAHMMTETSQITGRQVSYYVGFDVDGNLRFEPIDHAAKPIGVVYADRDYPNAVPIIGQCAVYNSVQHMRTDLHFQSIDPTTGELLYRYLPMPNWVKRACGFPVPWMERSARFGGEEGLAYVQDSAAWSVALPNQTVRLRSPYMPWVRAGMRCKVYEERSLGRWMDGIITLVRSRAGMRNPATGNPYCDSWSLVEVQDIANLL